MIVCRIKARVFSWCFSWERGGGPILIVAALITMRFAFPLDVGPPPGGIYFETLSSLLGRAPLCARKLLRDLFRSLGMSPWWWACFRPLGFLSFMSDGVVCILYIVGNWDYYTQSVDFGLQAQFPTECMMKLTRRFPTRWRLQVVVPALQGNWKIYHCRKFVMKH